METPAFKLATQLVTPRGRRLTLRQWLQKFAITGRVIYVGTDSRQTGGATKFTTVIVSYEPGKGGTYASLNFQTRRITSLRERLQAEAWSSIELAMSVAQEIPEHRVTIHLDVNSSTRYRSGAFASGLVGMVTAQGFEAEIKPRAFTATSLADSLVRCF